MARFTLAFCIFLLVITVIVDAQQLWKTCGLDFDRRVKENCLLINHTINNAENYQKTIACQELKDICCIMGCTYIDILACCGYYQISTIAPSTIPGCGGSTPLPQSTTPQQPTKSCGLDWIKRESNICNGSGLQATTECNQLYKKCCDIGCTDYEIKVCCNH